MSEKEMASNLLELRDDNFEAEVIESDLPVLVDFWAPWCGPCQAVGPTIAQLADEYEGRAKVGKLNVDDNHGVAGAMRIMSIPTVAVFRKNQVLDLKVGALGPAEYRDMLDKALASA